MVGPVRVLLVEDNPIDCRVLLETLSTAELTFRVSVCNNLAEGLARVSADEFDIVLLDLTLPDSRGIHTCERLLEASRFPVVVLTGMNDQMLGLEVVYLGAQDYLIKGQSDSQTLLRSITYAIARHESAVNDSAPRLRRLSATKPVWDPRLRELRLGYRVIKRFRQPSANQEAVLSAFNDVDWPSRIDDPLPYCADLDPKERLRTTIKSLNRHQHHSLIRFHGDGTGEAVLWSLTAATV